MPASLLDFVLFAQLKGAAPKAGTGGEYTVLLWGLAIALWFYVLFIRPQQKQEKQRKTLLNTLKKNDRVLTAAGMYGTVVSIDSDQDRVLVRVDDDRGVRIAFTRASIVKILDGSEDKAKDKDKEKDRTSKEKTKETA